MSLLSRLWADEFGAVLSAELVLLGTLGVIGVTVGVKTLATAVNDELQEVGFAVRSLDQSYAVEGFCTCGAWTAGSCFVQQDVAVSLDALSRRAASEDGPALAPPPVLPSPQPVPSPKPKLVPRKKSVPEVP